MTANENDVVVVEELSVGIAREFRKLLAAESCGQRGQMHRKSHIGRCSYAPHYHVENPVALSVVILTVQVVAQVEGFSVQILPKSEARVGVNDFKLFAGLVEELAPEITDRDRRLYGAGRELALDDVACDGSRASN